MDAELKETCRQAAGDAAADFFCWCCVILGHLLTPLQQFPCARRGDLIYLTCVCARVCKRLGWLEDTGAFSVDLLLLLCPLSRHH